MPVEVLIPPESPPAHLLADCPKPKLARPRTNQDLLDALGAWELALANCNGDKAGLRAWAEGVRKDFE